MNLMQGLDDLHGAKRCSIPVPAFLGKLKSIARDLQQSMYGSHRENSNIQAHFLNLARSSGVGVPYVSCILDI